MSKNWGNYTEQNNIDFYESRKNKEQLLARELNIKYLKALHKIMRRTCDMREEEVTLLNNVKDETKNIIKTKLDFYKNFSKEAPDKTQKNILLNKMKNIKNKLNNKNSNERKEIENKTFRPLRKLKNKFKSEKINLANELNEIKQNFYNDVDFLMMEGNFRVKNAKTNDEYWHKLLNTVFKSFKTQNPDCKKYLKYTKSPESTFEGLVDYLESAKKRTIRYENMNGGSKKTVKKIRKHKGIIQSGCNKGKIRKGYKYTGAKLKSGLYEIKKI
jgi:hypothetical protein